MSNLDRIADILRAAINDRATLAIGSSVATIYQGQSGLFLTASGKTVSAIATNFCYESCLLSKVDGVWYAINPQDDRQVVRSSVQRFITRKPKSSDLPTIAITIGILSNDDGGGEVIG
jgi:hypothetical protein